MAVFSSTLVILKPLLDVGRRLHHTLADIIAGAVGLASFDDLGTSLAFG
jgi:hypothetical protein